MSILVTRMGLFFMVFSFFVTRIRGALSRGPSIPAATAHKVYFFILGLIVFIEGLRMLFA
jgi:hypothetical protein